jgi:pimeloyl-ACP methyl ester carboxylesterase
LTLEYLLKKQDSLLRRFALWWISTAWNWHWSPFAFFRWAGYYPSQRFMANYVRGRVNLDSEREIQMFTDLLLQTLPRPVSSDTCLTVILQFGAFARVPMYTQIKQIQVPTCWLYGDHDWISREVANELMSSGALQPDSHIASVSNASHNLYADNVLGCA